MMVIYRCKKCNYVFESINEIPYCPNCYYTKLKKVKYSFGKYNIDTSKELYITTKYLLSTSPRNIEFKNDFFEQLINIYHQGVLNEKLKVTKFKILTFDKQVGKWKYAQKKFRGGILVTGFFEPMNEWHGVTLYPWKKKSNKSKIIKMLREKWSEKAEVRKEGQLCENCGIIPYPQLHHDNISFKEIAEKCLVYFTDKELKYGLGNDWWKQECVSEILSDDHPAVTEMFKLHKDVEYKWLCSNCHKEAHAKNKSIGKING